MDELVYEFECGCRFKQHDTKIKECDDLPPLSIDFYNLPDCPRVWGLLGTGRTKGVFQLEANLGQTWSKQLEPWNIEELSALISIIRPGVLKAYVDGVSLTKHFVERKHGREEVESYHPALDKILDSTHQILTYQEQAMRIAQEIAGFDLNEADTLRKAIGKKKADVMAQVKTKFIEGCKEQGIVDEEQAQEIFGWIQESQKYSFNRSHGVGYGMTSYQSAYVKHHFPLHYLTACLYYAKEKQDTNEEVEELIADGKLNDIEVYPPSIDTLFTGNEGEFGLTNGRVHFGIMNIKKVGRNHVNKFLREVRKCETALGKPIIEWSWFEFLVKFSHNTNVTVVNNMVSVGAMAHTGLSRKKMLFDFKIWNSLSDREKKWIRENTNVCHDLKDSLEKLIQIPRKDGGPATKNRVSIIQDLIQSIESPSYNLDDSPLWIANIEKDLLGVSLTCTNLDSCDSHGATATCKEYLDGKKGKMIFAVEIQSVREVNIKKGASMGKKMAFVNGEDQTGRIDSMMAFAETWEENKHLLYEGNTVLLTGQRSSKGDAFIINKVKAI